MTNLEQPTLTRRFFQTIPFYSFNFLTYTLLSIFFARWMGIKHYGAFVFAFHTIRITVLVASMGISQAAMKYLPKYLKHTESRLFRGFFRTGLFVNTSLGLLLGYLAFVTVLPVVEGSHSQTTLQHAWWICPLLGLNIYFSSVLRSTGHAVMAATTQGLLRDILALFFAYLLLQNDIALTSEMGIIIFASAIALCIFSQLIIQAVTIPKKIGQSTPTYNLKDWASTSFPMFLSSLSENVITIGGIILLRLIVDESSVAFYHAAWILTAVMIIPAKAVLSVVSPSISRTYSDDRINYEKSIKTSVQLLLFVTLPVCLILIAGGGFFLGWFGETYTKAYGLLVVLVFARAAHVTALYLGRVLSLSGAEKYVAKTLYILTAVIILPMTGLTYLLGAYGVPISYLVSAVFSSSLFYLKLRGWGRS